MHALLIAPGQTYDPVRLLTHEQGRMFDRASYRYLFDLLSMPSAGETRESQAQNAEGVIEFVKAASRGCVFYNRKERVFAGYRLDFDGSFAGYVLLDATADLAGVVTLNPLVQSADVPQVDYSPLRIAYLKQPVRFRRIDEITKTVETATPYAKWIRDVVVANSEPGEAVLIVSHKAMIGPGYLRGSNDPRCTLDWEGRNVDVLHWGSGVGLNAWKHKTSVMLFSEFFPRRGVTISEYYGWSERPMDADEMKQAEGRRVVGTEFAPQGPFRGIYDGHLWRWAKQLASRGSVRQIVPDENGGAKCGQMKLLVTMNHDRLLRGLPMMFPGASPPVPAVNPHKSNAKASSRKPTKAHKPRTGSRANTGARERLAELLATNSGELLGADRVQELTGIATYALSRELRSPAVAQVARTYGWVLKPAKAVGLRGRMNYLVRSPFALKRGTGD